MPTLVKVAKTSEIPAGKGKVIEVGGKTLAVFNCAGTFYATDNTCLHRGGPLGEGAVSGTMVTCPWHGWTYDVTSGACEMDASMKVHTYSVTVEGNEILVAV